MRIYSRTYSNRNPTCFQPSFKEKINCWISQQLVGKTNNIPTRTRTSPKNMMAKPETNYWYVLVVNTEVESKKVSLKSLFNSSLNSDFSKLHLFLYLLAAYCKMISYFPLMHCFQYGNTEHHNQPKD